MSTSLRIMTIRRGLGSGTTYPVTPSYPATPALPLNPNQLVENTDYGVVKVQNGKLVLDMQDFDADLGRF